MQKKYKLNLLAIEITRRCNMQCVHCMKGDAENITISKSVLDKVFNEIDDAQHIIINGGEPLIDMEIMRYLIGKLINCPWSVKVVEITTNGSICNTELIHLLELFCLSKSGRYANLRISNDQYHDAESYKKAFDFYTHLVECSNKKIKEHVDGGILVDYTTKNNFLSTLSYDGRAIDIIDNVKIRYDNQEVAYPCTFKHRIKVLQNHIIPCGIQISANGNICCLEQISYHNSDLLSIGNINDNHITNIIDNHNNDCMLLCSETDVFTNARYTSQIPIVGNINNHIVTINYAILKLRECARREFIYLPSQIIIDRIPFLSPLTVSNIMINKIDMLKFIESIKTIIFSKLYPMNQCYKEFFGKTDNSKIYPCNLTLNGVDYNEDHTEYTWNDYAEAIEKTLQEEFIKLNI